MNFICKILRIPNFNIPFQLVLTKTELFSCLAKVHHVIKSCKEPTVLSSTLIHRGLLRYSRLGDEYATNDLPTFDVAL